MVDFFRIIGVDMASVFLLLDFFFDAGLDLGVRSTSSSSVAVDAGGGGRWDTRSFFFKMTRFGFRGAIKIKINN